MFPLHTQLTKTNYYNDCKNHLLFLLHTEWPLESHPGFFTSHLLTTRDYEEIDKLYRNFVGA